MSEVAKQVESLPIDLLTWYEVNKKAVFIGLGAVVVAAAAVILWKGQQRSKLEVSSGALLATVAANKDGAPLADLQRVIQAHPGTPAATQAALLAGKSLFEEGKFAEARAQFESASNANTTDDLAAAAQYGIAACLDAENKTAEALIAYQRVIDFPGAKHLAGLARITKGRVHESVGQFKEAFACYEAVIKTPASSSAAEASQLRTELVRQHPELEVKPVLPPAAPTLVPAPSPAPATTK